MRYCFIFVAFVSLLCSCGGTQPVESADVLVRVKDNVLERAEIKSQIPRGISSADSLLLAESLEKRWVKDLLVYDVALRNLEREEKEVVDKLVENYKRSLIRHRYQEQLVKERLSSEFGENDKLKYYEENQERFVLDRALIKGLFLKIPIDAPGLADVKKWYKSTSDVSLENIEKYSLQNANIYDYFYDKWVDFDQVMDNIPLHVADVNVFLKNNKHIEVSDSLHCYLLNIKEFLPKGEIAPFEYASPQIVEMLTNLRRVEFLRKFEEELYNDAVSRGDVKFQTEP